MITIGIFVTGRLYLYLNTLRRTILIRYGIYLFIVEVFTISIISGDLGRWRAFVDNAVLGGGWILLGRAVLIAINLRRIFLDLLSCVLTLFKL